VLSEWQAIVNHPSQAPALPAATSSILVHGASSYGLELTDEQITRFARYQIELLDWNTRMNLTAIVDPAEIQLRHFLDSLTVGLALPDDIRWHDSPATLLDIGAGAGFPGVPLAIALPNLDVTLLEATQKKCRFLEHLVAALDLTNVAVRCGRAEDVAHLPREREYYDVVVARAVASLAALAELGLPFVRPGGRMIAPKKAGIEEEVAAARRAIAQLGGRLAEPIAVSLPIPGDARQLIVVDKIKPTPGQYPRRPGVPAKSPL
jgi:16S rRNA (guanine527-N7)-methyltransferase